MARSLTLKLVLAFLIVGLIGAALVAAFARWTTFREFDRLVLEQAQTDFVGLVFVYYQDKGSWAGIMDYLGQPNPLPPPPQAQPKNEEKPPQPLPFVFALVDGDGRVVAPAGPYRLGMRIAESDLRKGASVEVDGQVVGTVLATGTPPELDPREQRYLARTNQALVYAALGATLIALSLGVFLARTLTRPLRELTTAIRAMSGGELAQQVSVRSQDEVGELVAAFNQMSADLARANDLRRQMTADIAHDLRTPLTVITGYLESLRDGVLKPSQARFETMYNEARHLQRLIEDLRTLSLADAGELSLNCLPVSPLALLEQAAMAYRHQAEMQQIGLCVQAGTDLPEIDADPDRMMQVLGNLISNALRYTPKGGQITLSARRQADAVCLAVQDTGAGIAPEVLSHVFKRFYRCDASRQQQGGESGLGLAIARSIVEAHGGMIDVQSEQGVGTTFTVLLPVAL